MIKSKVGKHIKEIRMAKGYSQESFAIKCGLHRTYIAGVEAGNRNISLENLNKIAEALDVTLAELCDYEKPIHNTILLKINGETFVMESECELTPENKEDIEIICKLAYDDDEPSLDDELKEKGIESIYNADSYDIALALQRTIERKSDFYITFKSIDLETNISSML